ncbi:MAG: TetR/AcrR family transcriptional regulator [Clostridia bacterium]|nr:TetR/AcrR family transcriptional regulator [Clostridia bacterium]
MNKTKRKIFETSMKLFAEKGYDATSVEEITSVVGVAKGTLYYHFSSKEEIFYFLIEEGMKLLQNSIVIKTTQKKSAIEKLKCVILIQLKIIYKYQDFLRIILSQIWGKEPRNLKCKEYVKQYLKIVEEIVEQGIKNGEIIESNAETIAIGIFSNTCVSLLYKMNKNYHVSLEEMYKELEDIIFKGLKK